MILSAHFGVALAFIFGNYLTYNTSAIFMIVLSVLFAVLFFFFPETPTFLVKQNKIDVFILTFINIFCVLSFTNDFHSMHANNMFRLFITGS